MKLISWFSLLFLILAAFTWGYEVYIATLNWHYELLSGGELWAKIHINSLVGFQALVEKYTWQWLWWEFFFPILSLPAWTLPLILGFSALIIRFKIRLDFSKRH